MAILASRVRDPNQSDWNKLVRLMRYIHSTKGWHLSLSADDLRVIKWYVDASFAVHPDFKSHTGAVMTMGGGSMQALTQKQKLNSRSSTEAETNRCGRRYDASTMDEVVHGRTRLSY